MNIDPIDLLLRVSAKSEGASEVPAGSNAGPYVERVLKRVKLSKGQPWCAAEIADSGVLALESLWPLPLTGGCQELHDFALKHGVLYSSPQRGDVFLIWHPELKRFAHTGIIAAIDATGLATTHDGNTTQKGQTGAASREGWVKAVKQRRFQPEDRFIRWVELVRA